MRWMLAAVLLVGSVAQAQLSPEEAKLRMQQLNARAASSQPAGEVAELRSEVKRLRAENARLKAEIEQLKSPATSESSAAAAKPIGRRERVTVFEDAARRASQNTAAIGSPSSMMADAKNWDKAIETYLASHDLPDNLREALKTANVVVGMNEEMLGLLGEVTTVSETTTGKTATFAMNGFIVPTEGQARAALYGLAFDKTGTVIKVILPTPPFRGVH